MKRILLVSDNHGHMGEMMELAEKVGHVDYVLHMGDNEGTADRIRSLFDCPVVLVNGNCDHWSMEQDEEILDIEGHRIFMCHGHHQGVNWDLSGMESAAHEYGCDIALYGHTHVPKINYLPDMMIINPGSISKPRQDGRKCSFALLELVEDMFPCYCSIGYLD